MAEYCIRCAQKLGIKPSSNTYPCEGCGAVAYKEERMGYKMYRIILIALLITMALMFFTYISS